MLKRVGESRHPRGIPVVVRNHGTIGSLGINGSGFNPSTTTTTTTNSNDSNENSCPYQLTPHTNCSPVTLQGSRKGADPSSGGPPAPHRRTGLSVLDIIYETDQVEDAFKILDNHVVRCVIRDQWARYEALFCAWMVTHLLSMVWLTTYAVFKARLVSSEDRDFSPAGTNLTISFTSAGVTDSETKFVYASAVLGAILAMLLLVYEVVWLARRSSVKEYLVGLVYHHNGFYRLQMMVFSIFILLEVAFLAAWYVACCWLLVTCRLVLVLSLSLSLSVSVFSCLSASLGVCLSLYLPSSGLPASPPC